MKKLIKITVLLLLFNSAIIIQYSTAQWIQQTSGVNATLYDIEMVNQNTGWICGVGGTILKTTNGGKNWISVPNPAVGKPLFDIDVVDENTMYCVGWFETILKSTNAGANWFVIRNGPSGQGGSYLTCSFINEQTGWICGAQQKIMKTTNGGQTLDSIYLFVANMFHIYFKNPLEGLVTGEASIVKRSTDGGITWYQSNINLPTNQPGFRDFVFLDQNTGFMPARDGRIFKTTDFGNNWDSISKIIFTNEQLLTIDFVNYSTGFVGGTTAHLYKSTDGGYNWIRENISPLSITRLRFINDTIGWLVGTQGRIFKTTTGGQTFVNQISSEIPNSFSLYQNFPNPFNSQTTIEFDIKKKGKYSLVIYDCLGRKSEELFNEYLNAGSYKVGFNADELQSGVYFYRLSADGKAINTRKMLLIK